MNNGTLQGNNGTLQGKVALITGASSGIGEATALALAAQGAKVALAARRVERLEALMQRITESGGEALPLACDVADANQIRLAVQAVQDQWGRLDVLVNSAGIAVLGPILGADTNEWQRVVSVNVLGLMYATHAVLPLMKALGGGHIINISSTAGRVAPSGMSVYCASKWAVNGFSESLRQEALAYKVRVTLIEPGLVATEFSDHIAHTPAREATAARFASLRALDASDIAAAVVYALTQPPHVNVYELLLRPTEQV